MAYYNSVFLKNVLSSFIVENLPSMHQTVGKIFSSVKKRSEINNGSEFSIVSQPDSTAQRKESCYLSNIEPLLRNKLAHTIKIFFNTFIIRLLCSDKSYTLKVSSLK